MIGLSIGRAHSGPIIRQTTTGSSSVFPLGPCHEPALVLDQLTDFQEFFSALYPRMRSYHWFLDGALFRMPDAPDQWFDSEADRYRSPELDAFTDGLVATHREAILARPGFLETFAKYLVDDWCGILGIVASPEDPHAFLELHAGRPRRDVVPVLQPRADIAFFCIDGIRWEVFTRDTDLLSSLREDLSRRQDLSLQEVRWDECVE